jgi:L-ascorbate metabolism protein UlaG (beta-lactamase superfamily)
MDLLRRAAKDGDKFLNPVPTQLGALSVMFKVLMKHLRNNAEVIPKTSPGPFRTDPRVYRQPPRSGLRVTWFGHSALLLEIDGVRVLVDPMFDERASPVRWAGPKRFFAAPVRLEDLPPIDAVLISHDHYDHLGRSTVTRLATLNATARAVWVTSLGVGKTLRKFGVGGDRIRELDWTQTADVHGEGVAEGVRVTAWPARHFSGRMPWDRFESLWSSFVIEGPKHRVFFGADSGMWPGFAEIAARYEGFDLTMLEIGAFDPLWSDIHLGPDGAAEMYRQMGGWEKAGWLLPIHWGVFNLALHGWTQPVERMLELQGSLDLRLWLPEPGVPTEVLAEEPARSRWWQAPVAEEVAAKSSTVLERTVYRD